MPAKVQDVWYKPLTQIPLTEPRWVRAVEIRPGTPAGRKITHHALAYLQQEEPGSNTGLVTQGLLMEWAVAIKVTISTAPPAEELLRAGARVWWEMHYHAVGEEIRDHVELAVYLSIRRDRNPNTGVSDALPRHAWECGLGRARYSPELSPSANGRVSNTARAGDLENFQPHMHLRGKAMLLRASSAGRHQATPPLCGSLQLQLGGQLHLWA